MDSNNRSQPCPNLTCTPLAPMDGSYLPIWDAGQSRWITNGSPYADSREFPPMDAPPLLQLQFDRLFQLQLDCGFATPSPPFVPGMYTPLDEAYLFGSGQHSIPLQDPQHPPYLSQQQTMFNGGMPSTCFGCADPLHERRHYQHRPALNDAPNFVPSQPFTESSIFRGSGGHNEQHDPPSSSYPSAPLPSRPSQNSLYIVDPSGNVFPVDGPAHQTRTPGRVIVNGRDVTNGANGNASSASQYHLQPSWTTGSGDTYFHAPSEQRITGFHDLHLRAPGARIVIDGVDYTDRFGGTSQGTRERQASRTEPYHHPNRPRNVLNTRAARYLLGPRHRIVRHGRIVRDSDGCRRVIFPDINPRDDFHTYQDHHTHDQYLHLLNESTTKRLVCRPTPLHAPYTFGPSILADPFHEIAVDQNGMVVIREKVGALPADRRYPNCLCGKPMNDEELEGGWRLCLHCHGKVEGGRELVDVCGRPCLREWLEGGGEG